MLFCFLLLNPHVEKEGDTIPLQEEKPGVEKKSETLGTTAM